MPFYLGFMSRVWPERALTVLPLMIVLISAYGISEIYDYSETQWFFNMAAVLFSVALLLAYFTCLVLSVNHIERHGFALCRRCAYPLMHSARGRCPECGRAFRWDQEVAFWRRQLRAWLLKVNDPKTIGRAEANTPDPPERA